MRKNLLVFITPYKFRKFDWSRFEFSYLEKKFKTKIIVHELIDLIYPWVKKAYLNPMKSKKIYSFKDFSSWKKSFHQLLEKNYKVTLFPFLGCESFTSFLILKELKKSKINSFTFGSGQHPEFDEGLTVKQIDNFFINRLKRAILRPKKLTIFLNQKIFSFLAKIYDLYPTHVIKSGSRNFVYREKKVKVINGHAYDYSNYLIASKSKKNTKRDCIVYLEAPGPRSSGDNIFTHDPLSDFYTSKNWYPSLIKFFDLIEKITKLKIKIAPHPKVKHKQFPKYYGGREILNEELSKASFRAKAIISRDSQGLAYAVLHKVPAVMIYSDELFQNKRFMVKQKYFGEELGVKPININSQVKSKDIKKLFKIKRKIYKNYKSRYLTSRSDLKYNYEIMQDLINETFN